MEQSDAPQGHNNTDNKAQRTANSVESRKTLAPLKQEAKAHDCHSYSSHHPPPAGWWHRIDYSQVVLDLLLLIVGIKLACI